jgi:Protein of unknown function (DUF3293)
MLDIGRPREAGGTTFVPRVTTTTSRDAAGRSADEIPLIVPRHVREAYRWTEVSIELPRRGWLPATRAMRTLSPPVFVITASNPKSERFAEALNQERNGELRLELFDAGADVLCAVGSSPDGQHVEESLAALGIGRRRARAIGRRHGQWAIFELTSDQQIVVGCDVAWRVARPLDPKAIVEDPPGDTLYEAVAATFATGIVSEARRFNYPGWSYAGTTTLICPICTATNLAVFSAELTGRSGELYGAVVSYCPEDEVALLPPQMPVSLRRAVLAFRDFAHARADADALGLVERTNSVYVIGLAGCPLDDCTIGAVYVGQTGLDPEARFAQHKAGLKASRSVRRFGVELRPDLIGEQPVLRNSAEARTYERYLARRLEHEEWTVRGGH